MKKWLSSIFILCIAFSSVGCPGGAKENAAKGEEKGDVVVLDKAEFTAKVFDYEKNGGNWVYEGNKPCIVDFYADWCGPCKKVSPILKDLAALYKDEIVVYKVDVDAENELAAAFGISSIPTLLFVPAKGTPQIAQGALPREELIKCIDTFLLGKE
ncbi:MAG: thioredoxin [Tannerellaceae bacterium]|jgi:thioredoxin|nr:thioredoxin [Tannerellaceae bacterium]